MSERKEEKDKDAGLVSYTCQFCKMTFERGAELSLHITQRHASQIGKDAK